MISVQNISKKYAGNKKFSVQNLSLEIKKGEVFGFLGPNGAGKTTTIKMILGFLTPTKGSIFIDGNKPSSLEAKNNTGFLPEHANLYRYLTGREFLLFCGEIFGIDSQIIEKRIKMILLEKLKFPKDAIDRPIRGYSKGMQQRIGIAQAVIHNPEIVFLDEPMSGLDPIGRRSVKDLILHLKEEGKTVFFNSHILSDAEVLCDRIAIIKEGEKILEGTIEEITQKGNLSLEDVFINAVDGED